jgi:hypothetical protein
MAFVIYSCVFQSTAIINLSEKGFLPYVVASIFLILKSLPTLNLLLDIKRDAFVRLIVIFVLFSVSSSIILPIFWNGIIVYTESIDLMVVFGGEPLHFGVRNIIQCCYVIVNFLTIYCIYKNRSKISNEIIVKTFIITIITVLIIGFWEFTAKTTQLISFPYLLIYNNIGYRELYLQTTLGGLMRLNSLFLEPSYCGAFLSASFWAIMSIDSIKRKVLLCVLIGLALMLNLSGTGMLSFFAGFILYSYLRRSKILWLVPVFFALALIVSYMGYGRYISEMLLSKADSTSGIHRSTAAFFTWDLFLYTKGLGVGLGSHRGGGFILSTLAGIGIIGTFLFYKIYSRLLKSAISAQHIWLFMFGIVLFVAQCLAISDFSFCIMWMCLFMAAAVLPQKSYKK